MNRLPFALPFALVLTACGDKAEQAPANDTRGAEGEVLGGTISDDMLPLDTVTSQSPPLRESPAPGAGANASTDAGIEAVDGEVDSESPDPEPEPAPEDGA